MFLCPILLVMGVDLLQFLGVWFINAATEESFSLTRIKPHPLQEGIGLITGFRIFFLFFWSEVFHNDESDILRF